MANPRPTLQEEREMKRARHACENCRRKKTRCSGEKPVCHFCARLGQNCVYNGRVTTTTIESAVTATSPQASSLLAQSHAELAARLALVESRLGLDDHDIRPENPSSSHGTRGSRGELGQLHSQVGSFDRPLSTIETVDDTSKFSTVPPLPVLVSMADVYFNNCHNQPYCFFLESAFRQRLIDNTLPDYLLMAFVATAARYSNHTYFEGRQTEALETYATTAWHIILKQAFSSEQGLDLSAVQATNLLAVVDFTAGQHRLGWVKIGLAIRFAQGLRLNAEPDPAMEAWEQEEHRRAFWSVYVLDRFVSCCRGRPPSILDVDCTVMLPSNPQYSPNGLATKSPTLAVLKDLANLSTCQSLDHFALLILAASTLGRVVRYSLQQSTTKTYPPWDFRSDFAKILTILLSLEILLSIGDVDLVSYVQNHPSPQEGFDKPWAGHFIWSRGVYHMSYCLLYHPLCLYRHLQHHKDSFPRSFARTALRHCQEHAELLTGLLRTVLDTGCCARGSFLGYLAVVAGSVHRIFEHSTNPPEQLKAQQLSQSCLDFLEQGPAVWGNYPRMAKALKEFQVDRDRASALTEPRLSDQDVAGMKLDTLSCILDYGWLSDARRSDRSASAITPQPTDLGNWSLFEDFVAIGPDRSFDPVAQGLNTLMTGRSGRTSDWWPDESGDGPASGSYLPSFDL